MSLVPELRRAIKVSAPAASYVKGCIFFAIYYDPPDDDDAFKRAAVCWRKRLMIEGVASAHDPFIMRAVTFERDFKLAWAHIAATARTRGMEVGGGQIFSHASKQENGEDGLEFRKSSDPADGQTLKGEEIDRLEGLPWSKDGFLILSGCNTGLTGDRGWSPARRFARAQGVTALGLPGYGYFSKSWDRYKETGARDQEIYLWAYRRGWNSPFGGGYRLPGVVFNSDGDRADRRAPKEGPFMAAGAPM